jgi:Mpv17 / PMP22 family
MAAPYRSLTLMALLMHLDSYPLHSARSSSLRFVLLHLVTAPPNYKWQELLEHYFPARESSSSHTYISIPLADREEEEEVPKDHDSNVGDEEDLGSNRRRRWGKLNLRNLAIKWFLDCITLGAIMNTTAFIMIMGILKGQGPLDIWQNMRTKMVKIIVNGYKLWPVANAVAHAFVPVERRILFFGCVAFFWNIYLSLMAARL